nr:hypothetical protein [uncultured Acetatifactor sp.]
MTIPGAVQKIQSNPYREAIDSAYLAGYMDAMQQERKKRTAARRRRERKRYFAMQKITGVAMLIFTAAAVKALEGDATIALITVPLGLSLLLSREMLIINRYYWKCQGETEKAVE